MLHIALIAYLKKTGLGRGLFGVMRVSGYFAVVGAVGSVVMIHEAKAAFRENSMILAQDLLPMSDLLKDGHTLNLNGQRIHIASTTTTETSTQVLDRYEAACKSGNEDAQVWNSIPNPQDPKSMPAPNSKEMTTMPIVRTQAGTGGAVSCFVRDASARRPLTEEIEEFFATGDLGKLGKLRYVTVGSAVGGTGVITAWTDDSFNVNALAPADGTDAPGADPVNLPRPSKSNRLLSGGLEGMPYGVYMYVTDSTPSAAIADYDVQMADRKWTIVKSFHFEKRLNRDQEIRGYLNPATGVQVFVACAKLDDGRTGIGISESHDFQDATKLPNPGSKAE